MNTASILNKRQHTGSRGRSDEESAVEFCRPDRGVKTAGDEFSFTLCSRGEDKVKRGDVEQLGQRPLY